MRLSLGLVLFSLAIWPALCSESTPLYLDPTQPIWRRVDDLLPRLNIDEKIAQLADIYSRPLQSFEKTGVGWVKHPGSVQERNKVQKSIMERWGTRPWFLSSKHTYTSSIFFNAMKTMCVSQWKESARRMASTTSDTGDTSSKQQRAQHKEKYNKSKRPVSSVDHCHPKEVKRAVC